MNLTRDDTSEKRVIGFLDLTRDLNIVHREGGRILPGMFYIALLAPYLDKPLTSIDISFTGFRQYPLECNLDITSADNKTIFSFSDQEGQLCKGEAGYSESAKADNSGLEEFAEILRVPKDDTNLRALWLTCQTPGELVRELSKYIPPGQRGFYAKQSFNLSDYLPANASLRLNTAGIKTPLTRARIGTDYYSGDTKVAEGKALVFVG